ncbi:peptidoglycan-binding domain-containing protein [Streptomyces sp. Tu 3180]|uniref:peptidoglycan-binding domain-containing protein n=1 Tax=Streptomyces sp. Tu 3180 TaxID=2682611 RepID=UPI00135BEAF7|nr:peptidoglycan-binding domain-containing protein [Streptomyces sp. Tu 3180]KAF3469073.1 peptidoglycan-binding protein [Streptomyces sp. Tu 3180]
MATPPGSGKPHDGPPPEPVHVLRPRPTDALAELFREFEREGAGGRAPAPPPARPAGSDDRTRELPPLTAGRPPADGRRFGGRRAAPALAVAAAAAIGFGGALLLTERDAGDRAEPAPRPPATAPARPSPSPALPGVLREGDAGPEVAELQERLLRVPDVYRRGTTDGRYDATVSEAVARFQLWYGVRGDETGVYGDDTRLALESRTADVSRAAGSVRPGN